eukprot:558508-Rhodomonas_salina.1
MFCTGIATAPRTSRDGTIRSKALSCRVGSVAQNTSFGASRHTTKDFRVVQLSKHALHSVDVQRLEQCSSQL